MAFTASALSFMLENLTKPVILTGSQLPIGQLRTDGKENLVTSIEIAAAHHEDGTPIVPEVCIYFNGSLLRGNRSTKINADGFNAFDSFNYPHLADAGINIVYHEEHILKPDYTKPMIPHYASDPNILVFTLFPGIQDSIVRNMLDIPEIKGIVMRSYGSGNAPQKPWLLNLLKEAADRGVDIINISQCAAGTVEMARYDTGYHLKNAGVISGYDGTVESAVAKLMYLHGNLKDSETIRYYLNQNLRGEITL
jgi:L-asparaginase